MPDELFTLAERAARLRPLPDWLATNALQQLGVQTHPYRLARIPAARGRRVMEVLYQAMSEGSLPSLLRYGDRNAMRFSIENRVPFLTLPLAEFVLSLPEEYLIAESGESKSIFRAAMRGIVPDPILDRRDKLGFETPIGSLMAGLINGLKAEKFRDQSSIINIEIAKCHINNRGMMPQNFSAQDWKLINFILWNAMLHDFLESAQ